MVTVVTSLNYSCTHVDWCKFCTCLKRMNVRHFGTVNGLKILHQGHLQWQEQPTKVHDNLPIGSNVIAEGHRQTDRQATL